MPVDLPLFELGPFNYIYNLVKFKEDGDGDEEAKSGKDGNDDDVSDLGHSILSRELQGGSIRALSLLSRSNSFNLSAGERER